MRPMLATIGGLAVIVWLSLGTRPVPADEPRGLRDLSVLPAGAEVTGDYFGSGRRVEVSGLVRGDVYAAGGDVLVDGEIRGDLLAAGGTVTIAGSIGDDVRVAGGQVILSGHVAGNLTVTGGDVQLTDSARVGGSVVAAGGRVWVGAPIGRDARIVGRTITVSNRLAGELRVAAATVRLTSKAVVEGDFRYWSEEEASIEEGAVVRGRVTREALPDVVRPGKAAGKLVGLWVGLVTISALSTLILGLLLLTFYPVVSRLAVATVAERPGAVLLAGLGGLVLIPAVAGLLMATVVALPVGLILLLLYLILLYVARIYAIAWLGGLLWRRFSRSERPPAAFVVGLLLYYVLAVIPALGTVVTFLAVLVGLGASLLVQYATYRSLRREQVL